MKIITFTLCLFGALSVYSSENINIICESPGITTINQFELVGTVQVGEDAETASGSFSITTRRQGRDSETIETVTQGTGTVNRIEAGSMAKEEVVHVQMVNKGEEVEYISIVGGHPGALSSQVRLSSGVTYRSKCNIE
jgi:hypothetical protein